MNSSLLIRVPLATKSLFMRNLPIVLNRTTCNKSEDTVTHTGQKWDADDYRLVRFINSPKQVNTKWAINLISEVPPMEVSERIVWCDGGSGAEGHPKVYINLDKPGDHTCGYCGLRFVKKEGH